MQTASPTTRIALVITELEVGGAERCLVHLAAGLDRRVFEPVVWVLAPPPDSPRDALVHKLRQADVPTRFLGFASKWRASSALRELTRAIDQTRPRIVQSMLFHANVLCGWAIGRRRDVAWCAGIRVADPSRIRQVVERQSITCAQRVVCVSQLVAGYAQHQLRVPSDRLVIVPNGVAIPAPNEESPMDLQTLGVPAARRVITSVARLEKQKGLDQLILSAPHLLGALPQHDLLIVGDGSQHAALRRLAARVQVADRVHFCGWQARVGAILRASDLLVLPSRWEGMPNVLLEAMARCLPVVCTRVEGVAEVLGPLAEPQTVAAGQPQEFASQVVRILSEPMFARQLGAANQQRVATHFSLAGMLQQYETLYQGVSRAGK